MIEIHELIIEARIAAVGDAMPAVAEDGMRQPFDEAQLIERITQRVVLQLRAEMREWCEALR